MTDPRNTPESRAEARAHLDAALVLVEDAQHTLEKAAQALSSIVGAAPENDRIAKEAERVHALWNRLAYRIRDGGKADGWFMDRWLR